MFPSLVLGKILGSPVHYCGVFLDSLVHAVLGKGSVGSSVLYWGNDLWVLQSNTGKRFYRLISKLL